MAKEGPAPGSKDNVLTEFRLEQPIGLVTFAVGPYEIHKDIAKEDNGKALPIEFYSMPGSQAAIKEDFILAEMNNSVRFFSKMFGEYPPPLRGVRTPSTGQVSTDHDPGRRPGQLRNIPSSRMRLHTSGGATWCSGAPIAISGSAKVLRSIPGCFMCNFATRRPPRNN